MNNELIEKYKKLLEYLTDKQLIYSIDEFHENDFSTLINKNLLIIFRHKTKNLKKSLDWSYLESEKNTKYIIIFLLNTVISDKKPLNDYEGKNLIEEEKVKYRLMYEQIFQFLEIDHKYLLVNDYFQIKDIISGIYKNDKKQFEKI